MLNGKTIFITGSSRGIGFATAKLAVEYGAKVIIHASKESDELKKAAQELSCSYVFFDVSDQESVNENIAKMVSDHGTIHGLANCAGVVIPKSFSELDQDNWSQQIAINLRGTAQVCQALAQQLAENNGAIVNTASIRGHAHMSTARGIPYSASKAGVISLTSALAKELAPKVRVNSVSPGFTMTEMSKTWNDTVWDQARSSLLARAAEPKEQAEVILFLLSDRASFITGQDFLVDGGYSISGK